MSTAVSNPLKLLNPWRSYDITSKAVPGLEFFVSFRKREELIPGTEVYLYDFDVCARYKYIVRFLKFSTWNSRATDPSGGIPDAINARNIEHDKQSVAEWSQYLDGSEGATTRIAITFEFISGPKND